MTDKSSDKPETLEETQKRLSSGAKNAAPYVPQQPTASPVSPYGPPTTGSAPTPPVPPPAPSASRGSEPTDPVYPTFTEYQPAAQKTSVRRPLVIAGIVLLVIAGAGFAVAVFSSSASAQQWSTYPGTAYRDAEEAFNGDSLEIVMSKGNAAIADFQRELTEELGMDWTVIYDETLDHDYNYYGGQSMLYFWDTGLLEGSVATDDPNARQKIQDAFERITNAAGGQSFYSWNDMLDEGDEFTLEYYGLGGKDTQAIWALGNRDDRNGMSFSADIFDRNMPVDETFHGDYAFDIDDSDPNNLFVHVFVSAPALLSEADRAEFIERLKPFEGLTKPDATD